MSLARRDEHLAELMDDPDCDPVRLERTLRRFTVVNRLVSGWGHVYREHVRPALVAANGAGGTARILDIGCGGGDVLRGLVTRARRDGLAVDAVGIDPDERGLSVARATTVAGIDYRAATSAELTAEGATFDVVVSNHVLHHLTRDALDGLLADSQTLAGRIALHSDIQRGALAYAAYAVGITPLAPGSFLRTDGLRSIRRSYTVDELRMAVPSGWRVQQPVPFRLLATWSTGKATG